MKSVRWISDENAFLCAPAPPRLCGIFLPYLEPCRFASPSFSRSDRSKTFPCRGRPVAVILPYDDYLKNRKRDAANRILELRERYAEYGITADEAFDAIAARSGGAA